MARLVERESRRTLFRYGTQVCEAVLVFNGLCQLRDHGTHRARRTVEVWCAERVLTRVRSRRKSDDQVTGAELGQKIKCRPPDVTARRPRCTV